MVLGCMLPATRSRHLFETVLVTQSVKRLQSLRSAALNGISHDAGGHQPRCRPAVTGCRLQKLTVTRS